MPQLSSPLQLHPLKPLERLVMRLSLLLGVGKPAVPSNWPLLFGLALLPVLIWLAAMVLVGLGLALGITD